MQDIFSAIALSTEVPQKNMLGLTWPAKRQENLITTYILKLVFVQFVYQFIATVFVLFFSPMIFGIE